MPQAIFQLKDFIENPAGKEWTLEMQAIADKMGFDRLQAVTSGGNNIIMNAKLKLHGSSSVINEKKFSNLTSYFLTQKKRKSAKMDLIRGVMMLSSNRDLLYKKIDDSTVAERVKREFMSNTCRERYFFGTL